MSRFALAFAVALLHVAAFAQEPAAWPSPLPITAGEPPAPVVPSGVPELAPPPPIPEVRLQEPGQQHWVSLNLSIFQPTIGRVGVKVWPRPQGSLWLEAYGGSVLFDTMYGFGVRLQYTAKTNSRGDALMLAPGLGVHIVPVWGYYPGSASRWAYSGSYVSNSLYFVAADLDISWLHDFTPHCGYEIGVKLGLAARVAGDIGPDYPRALMFGSSVYPILNVYSGLRF